MIRSDRKQSHEIDKFHIKIMFSEFNTLFRERVFFLKHNLLSFINGIYFCILRYLFHFLEIHFLQFFKNAIT
jgi:hypothetical protein